MRTEIKPEAKWLPIEKVKPYLRNAKKHSKEQIRAIAQQISSVGWTQPIVVDKDFVIIAGHGRRLAALDLGLKNIPVVTMEHLTEDEVTSARIADNKVSEGQEWDRELLKFEIATLERNEFNLELTGFQLAEIEGLHNESEPTERSESGDGEAPRGDEENSRSDGAATQFIVTIECAGEDEMREVFEEMQGRGMKVRMIT